MTDNKTYSSLKFSLKVTINILTFQYPVSVEKVTSGKGLVRNRTRRLLEKNRLCTVPYFRWPDSGPLQLRPFCQRRASCEQHHKICIYSLDHHLCTWDIPPGVPTSRPRGSSWHAARPSIGRGRGGCKQKSQLSTHAPYPDAEPRSLKWAWPSKSVTKAYCQRRKIKHFT